MMSTFVQIHTLTSHSSHCLNRDDLGHPKTVRFLGNNHGRISSQCQKRAIRQYMREEEMKGDIALRTKRVPQMVREYLLKQGIEPSVVYPLIPVISALGQASFPSDKAIKDYVKLATKTDISDSDRKKLNKSERTPQLIHIKLSEIETLKETALDICQEGGKATEIAQKFRKAIEKKLKNPTFTDGVDIAMFGRMTTSPVFGDCDASVPVAHAMTTHPVFDQSDFFTAVDDLGEEGEGSGHMDDKAFSSGIFYRYASVNQDQLLENLDDDAAITRQAIVAFLRSFIMALPTGSQNAFAAYQYPYAVMITIGSGCPTNLSNGFAVENKAKNPLEKSARQLVAEFERSQSFFGTLKPVEKAWITCQYPEFIPETAENLEARDSLEKLLETVSQALEER